MAMIFALGVLMILSIFGMSLLAKRIDKWLNNIYRSMFMPKHHNHTGEA